MADFRPDLDYLKRIWPTLNDAEKREFYRLYQSEASPAQARADLSKIPAAALDTLLLAPRGVVEAAIDTASALGRAGQTVGKALGVVPGEAEPVNIPNPYRSMTPFYDYVREIEAKYPLANVPFEKFVASLVPPPVPPPPARPTDEEGGVNIGDEAPSSKDAKKSATPSPAVGLPPLKLSEIKFLQSPEERRAAVEKGVAARMGELGEYKTPDKTILDSPYTALIQAGLGMLMGGAGKSPLEAIATGGQRGFEAAKEIAGRQEARAEKEYGRKLERVKLRASLEKEYSDLAFKSEDLHAKFLQLENERQKGMNDADYRRRHLELEAQANLIRERAAGLQERRFDTTERGQNITALQAELNRLEQQYDKALDDRRKIQIQREMTEVRNRLRALTGTESTAPPSAKSQLGNG